jgi:hypothetical protein
LTKYIQLLLTDFLPEDNNEILEKISLIKILIKYQNLLSTISLSENIEPSYMVTLMSDPEIQQFFLFNRYKNILWFNAERFKTLMRWFFLMTVIQSLRINEDLQAINIQKTLICINKWTENAEFAGYQVQKFLDLDKNSNNK